MTNRSKANKTAIFVYVLSVASGVFLSSCNPVMFSAGFVCVARDCESMAKKTMSKVWEHNLLDQQNCPNISGKYKTGTYKFANQHDDLLWEFSQSGNQFDSIRVILETQEKIPSRFIPMPTERNRKAGVWDNSEFYNGAHVLIQQNEQNLAVSLIGQDGKVYRKRTILLDSPMIGCTGGNFIIRTVGASGFSESGLGSAYATEKRFRRLADGSLQVMKHKREWRYNYGLGLFGMNPDGTENYTGKPRESGYTSVFQRVP